MAVPRPAFTIGIEEEYLLVDPSTRDLVANPPPDVLRECQEILGDQVGSEFLRAQIEVGTKVCPDVPTARADLVRLRRGVMDVAEAHDMALIAASTHPFAAWDRQRVTDKERYVMLAKDLQVVARRLVICGMHVHVGVEDPDLRLDLMNQAVYFLPHLLALSTSSPFWHGTETGLKSYRMSVFYSLPRTGLPEQFSSWGEYERHVRVLVDAGLIEDASKLWWDIRPSARYPTIEMRIADICTRIDDGIGVAALFQSLLGMLFERRSHNQKWRAYADMLVSENIWRAERYGVSEPLADFGRGELVPYEELLDELIELVTPAAERLGCLDEVKSTREIPERGTSADRQLAVYREAVEDGADEIEALSAVVDLLVAETKLGLGDD
ncbi:MAG: carboxylate-amine ligase [Acidimicrobiia bacterium]|nr:carboxylate-amine ligase [Acidimicrobiia bacterium]